MKTAGLAVDFLYFFVKIDRIGLLFGDVRVAIQRMKSAGSVPSGPGRKLRTLNQHYIRPACFRQVIEHTAPNNAATDYRDAGLRFHDLLPLLPSGTAHAQGFDVNIFDSEG